MLSRGLNQLMINIFLSLVVWWAYFSQSHNRATYLYTRKMKNTTNRVYSLLSSTVVAEVMFYWSSFRYALFLYTYRFAVTSLCLIYQLSSVTVRYKYSFIILIRIDVVPFCSGLWLGLHSLRKSLAQFELISIRPTSCSTDDFYSSQLILFYCKRKASYHDKLLSWPVYRLQSII